MKPGGVNLAVEEMAKGEVGGTNRRSTGDAVRDRGSVALLAPTSDET